MVSITKELIHDEVQLFKSRLKENIECISALLTSTIYKKNQIPIAEKIENTQLISTKKTTAVPLEISLAETIEELGFIPSEDKVA